MSDRRRNTTSSRRSTTQAHTPNSMEDVNMTGSSHSQHSTSGTAYNQQGLPPVTADPHGQWHTSQYPQQYMPTAQRHGQGSLLDVPPSFQHYRSSTSTYTPSPSYSPQSVHSHSTDSPRSDHSSHFAPSPPGSGGNTPPGDPSNTDIGERPRRRQRTNTSHSSTNSEFQAPALSRASSVRSRSRGHDRMHTRQPHDPRFNRSQTPGPGFGVFSVQPAVPQNIPGTHYVSTVDFNPHANAYGPAVDHGPTDLPPRPYYGGPDAESPWRPRRVLGTIPGSAMEHLPALENRMHRVERALGSYIEQRGQQALQNSRLPGLEDDDYDHDNGNAGSSSSRRHH